MVENKYLNEEKYQKAERTITIIAILVLVAGLCIGGFLIYKGVAKPKTSKMEDLKTVLETKKRELESKGIKFNGLAKYSDGEVYDLKIVTNALDPSFDYCAFDEYKNNSITKEYCVAKNRTGESASIVSIMVGTFICVATFMISVFLFMLAKKRHIVAFQAQQVMPIAKEGINEMAPSIGKVSEEIAKGIKKGLDDDEE